MRTVVSYPGVMPAATNVALAFQETGELVRYESAFVHRPHNLVEQAVGLMPAHLAAPVTQQLRRRCLDEIRPELVRTYPVGEVLRSLWSQTGLSEVVAHRIWDWSVRRFDHHVAAALGQGEQAVYAYEYGALATFERASELGIRKIIDLPSPHYSFTDPILEQELRAYPETETNYTRVARRFRPAYTQRKQAEYDLADVVIANSQLTARSLTDTGYPADRIRVVPLGAPPVDGRWREVSRGEGLKFLYAGVLAIRKGAHQLLQAWRDLDNPGPHSLTLAGAWNLPRSLGSQLPQGARRLNSIPQPELFRLYLESDVLVFPSMCDGFAMVVTEAMSHGLPVITTSHVGAADLIEEGVNGWVIEPGNPEALGERLQWCMDHPLQLRGMREAAAVTASRHPWSSYRERLREALEP